MERIVHEGRVDVVVGVESLDESAELVLGDENVFVFSLINCAFDPVSLVVVHGVAHGEPAHEVADPWFFAPDIFFEH